MEGFLEETLKYQIESSPFSEMFTASPADGGEPFEIRGIFDESIVTNDDKKSTRPIPRIMVYEVPEYESGKTEITVRGRTYRIQKHETDANIGSLIFLI